MANKLSRKLTREYKFFNISNVSFEMFAVVKLISNNFIKLLIELYIFFNLISLPFTADVFSMLRREREREIGR